MPSSVPRAHRRRLLGSSAWRSATSGSRTLGVSRRGDTVDPRTARREANARPREEAERSRGERAHQDRYTDTSGEDEGDEQRSVVELGQPCLQEHRARIRLEQAQPDAEDPSPASSPHQSPTPHTGKPRRSATSLRITTATRSTPYRETRAAATAWIPAATRQIQLASATERGGRCLSTHRVCAPLPKPCLRGHPAIASAHELGRGVRAPLRRVVGQHDRGHPLLRRRLRARPTGRSSSSRSGTAGSRSRSRRRPVGR